ncbi:hypothetical protein HPP92_007638 [Vanilla planifolia]|nr:hypothetical protein HPP92_007638 [Vanilla planifolia]
MSNNVDLSAHHDSAVNASGDARLAAKRSSQISASSSEDDSSSRKRGKSDAITGTPFFDLNMPAEVVDKV